MECSGLEVLADQQVTCCISIDAKILTRASVAAELLDTTYLRLPRV